MKIFFRSVDPVSTRNLIDDTNISADFQQSRDILGELSLVDAATDDRGSAIDEVSRSVGRDSKGLGEQTSRIIPSHDFERQ